MRRLDILPGDLGLPDKFTEFRLIQQDFISHLNDWDGRVVAAQMPTGSGKSLAYMAGALFAGTRAVVLTSSKGLQNQLMGDFTECGLVDVRGRNNFPCKTREGKSCEWGANTRCPLRRSARGQMPECRYIRQLITARGSALVETNYSYHMAITQFGEGLGKVDMLILDEAHAAPEEICKAASVQITGREVYTMLRGRVPNHEVTVNGWVEFAQANMARTAKMAADLRQDVESGTCGDFMVRELLDWSALELKLTRLCNAVGDWAVEKSRDSWNLTPLWPQRYAEDLLFKGIGKVVLVSATIQPKTLSLMGLSTKKGDGTLWLEYPSNFPPKATPFYYIPTVSVKSSMTEDDKVLWLERIDEIIDGRLDRKGIIHAVSYDRARYILENSRHGGILIAHDPGEVQDTVDIFKSVDPPAVLVSPSTTTGYDFPGDECRYQIHCKVPFSDPRNPITAGRSKQDRKYSFYATALDLVQSDGRGTRSKDDWCENFMIDDQWQWFIGAAGQFFPGHFRRRVKEINTVPPAPSIDGGPLGTARGRSPRLPPLHPRAITRPSRELEYTPTMDDDDIPY